MSHHWRDIRRQLSPEQEASNTAACEVGRGGGSVNEPREQEQVNKAGNPRPPAGYFESIPQG